ncbi:MAG: transposase [Minisyncoccota bacterium]
MRRITFSEGEYYHIYNRGVDKRIVFTRPAEYTRFLMGLYLLNDEETRDYGYSLSSARSLAEISEAKPRQKGWKPLVAIGAHCLMPNHFHLYMTPLAESGISRFMQRLQTAYTMFFNREHERSGSLFQGTFKAQHVTREEHAKYLFSYIHLNCAALLDKDWKECGVRDLKKMRNHILAYPYSSAAEYAQNKHVVTDPRYFPKYFRTAKDVDDHIDFWLQSKAAGDFRGLASEMGSIQQ